MSNRLPSMAGLLVLVLAVFSPLQAQTVDEVLAKMIEARGGAEALLAIMDCAMYGEVHYQQGTSASISQFWKTPDKYRQEMQTDTMFIATFLNGAAGWSINPRNHRGQKMSGEPLKTLVRNALPPAAICDPAKHGLAFELKGRETALGKDCYVLEMTYPDGLKEQQLVDSQSHFVIIKRSRVVMDNGATVDAEVRYLGYKRFGGVMFPSLYANLADGREYNRVKIADIKVNGGLADSLFEPEK